MATYKMMSSILIVFLSIVLLLSSVESDSMRAISTSNLNFTNSIYKILSKQEGNVFFSPLSIQVILALTYLGARGSTAQQMAAGLHLPAQERVIKDGFKAMITSLKSDGKITLSTANRLFPEQTFTMKSTFVEVARNSFLADVQAVDFKNHAEAARLLINKWVESKTNNKIKNLIQPGIVDELTVLVLVNAVYFKGDWAEKFDPTQTKKRKFYTTATLTKDVDMMHQLGEFGYTSRDDLECKVLQIPYAGNKLSMVIFLPNAVEGIARLEAKLTGVDLPKLMRDIDTREVDVWLPKFKMEKFTDLAEVLKELGMVNMFDKNSANFSGIADGRLYVSSVVHKAFIKVNEKGSEAAAATGVAVVEYQSDSIPAHFIADRPFVFHIRDNNSGAVLFVGRLNTV